MSKAIPSRSENPEGLHMHYQVKKANGNNVDKGAEYFPLRLDTGGGDPKHIFASRQAILTYAGIIGDHLPKLALEIRQRWAPRAKRYAILYDAKGKTKGQFRFKLIGDNGEVVGVGEAYTTKAMALKTLHQYHPAFPVHDITESGRLKGIVSKKRTGKAKVVPIGRKSAKKK